MENEETFDDVLDEYIDQEKINNWEGERGYKNLCKLARAIGYRDSMNWGQLDNGACIGDLLCMLEDNPGIIEAIVEKIREYGNDDEWKENLLGHLPEKEEKIKDNYDDGECPDCQEDIPDDMVDGGECTNCGHVFTNPVIVDES